MRDKDLRQGPRYDDRPELNDHDESVDLVARERDESREECEGYERVGRENHEADWQPEPIPDAKCEGDPIPDHCRSAELVDEGVVPGQTPKAREWSRKDVERQAERKRPHD